MRRNTLMLVASIGTATLLVFLLGLFWLLFMNVRQMEDTLASQIEIHAYLKSSVGYDQAKTLEHTVAGLPSVRSVAYVTQDEALARLQKDVNTKIDLSGIMQNPLPSYLALKVKNPEDIPGLSKWLQAQPEVDQVQDLQQVVGRMVTFFKTTDHLFLGLVVLMLFCTLFIIYNTIRLGVFSRKKEIEIMQLVGASPGLVRWPFILEGAFYGLVGAVLAIAFLEPGYRALAGQLAEIFPAFPFIQGEAIWSLFGWLLVIGSLVGSSGSFLSVNRYLEP